MRKIIIIILFTSLFALIRCSSDDDIASFDGITVTNEFAVISGNVDESDWGVDEDWNNQEASLFELNVETANNNTNIDISNFDVHPNLGPAYPNPSGGLVVIQALNIDFNEGELVLVDNRYNAIVGPISITPGSEIQFQIEVRNQMASFFQTVGPSGPTPTVNSGQILRAYYYFRIEDQNVYLKGHGDILFE